MAARFVLLSAVALICVASLVQESSASCLRHTYKSKCCGKHEVPHYEEPCSYEEESYNIPAQEFHVYSGRPYQPTVCETHSVNVEAPPSRSEEPCYALGYGLQVPVKKSYRQKYSSHGYDVEVPKRDEETRCSAYGIYVDSPAAPENPKCSSHYYQVESVPQKSERRNAYGIAVAVPKKRIEHVQPISFNYNVETPKEKQEEERYAYGIAVQKYETQRCDPCEDVYETPIEGIPPPPPPCKPCVDDYVLPPQRASVVVRGSACSCGECSSCTAGGYSYDYSGEAAGESAEDSYHSHTRYGHGSEEHKEHYGGSRKYSASGDYSRVSTDGCVHHQSVIVPRLEQVEQSYISGVSGDSSQVSTDGCVHHRSVIVPRLEKVEQSYASGDSGDYSRVSADGCVHHRSVIVPRLEQSEHSYVSGDGSSYYSNDKYGKMSEASGESQIESPISIAYSIEPHYSKCLYHTLFPSARCSHCSHHGGGTKGIYVSDLNYYTPGNSYNDALQDMSYEETDKYAGGLAHEICCCCCASKTEDYGKDDYKGEYVESQKGDADYPKGEEGEGEKTYEGGSYEKKLVVVEEEVKDTGEYSGDKDNGVVKEEVKESVGYSEGKDYGVGYSGGKDYGETREKVVVEETITESKNQYEEKPEETDTVTVTKYVKSSEVTDSYAPETDKVVVEKEVKVQEEGKEQGGGYDVQDEIKEVTVTTTTVTKTIGGRSKETSYHPEEEVPAVKKISSGEYGGDEGGDNYTKKVVVTKTVVNDDGYGGKSKEYSTPEKEEAEYESDTYKKYTSSGYKSRKTEGPHYVKKAYVEKPDVEYGKVVKKIGSMEYGGDEGGDGYTKKVVVTKTVVNEGYGGKSKEYTIPEKEETEYETDINKNYKSSEYKTKGPQYIKKTYHEKPEEEYEKVVKKISGREYGGEEGGEGYTEKVVVTKTVVNEGYGGKSKEYTIPEKEETEYETDINKNYKSSEYKTKGPHYIKKTYHEKPEEEYEKVVKKISGREYGGEEGGEGYTEKVVVTKTVVNEGYGGGKNNREYSVPENVVTEYESPSEIYKKYKSSEYKSRETEKPRYVKKNCKEKTEKECDNKVRYSAERYRSSENEGKSYERPYVVTNGKPMNIRKAKAEEIYYNPRRYEIYVPKDDDPAYLPNRSYAEDVAVSGAKYIPCISVATVVGVGGSTEPANVVCQTDSYDRKGGYDRLLRPEGGVGYKSSEAKHHKKYDGNSQAYSSFVGSSRKEQLKKVLTEDSDDDVVEYRPIHRSYGYSGEKDRIVEKVTKSDYDKNGGSDYEYSNRGKIATSKYENNHGANLNYVDQKYIQKKGSEEKYPEGYGNGDKYEKKVTIIKKSYSGEKTEGYDDGEQNHSSRRGSSEAHQSGGYNQDYEKKVTYAKETYSGEKVKYGGEGSGERKYGGDGYINTNHVTRKGYSDDYMSGGYKEEEDKDKYEKKVTVIKKTYSGETKNDYDGNKYGEDDYSQLTYTKNKGSSESYRGYDDENKEKYEKKVTVTEKKYNEERVDGGYDSHSYVKKGSHENYKKSGYDEDDKEKYEKKVIVAKEKIYSGEKKDEYEKDVYGHGKEYHKTETNQQGGYDDGEQEYEKKVTIIKKSYSGEKIDYPEDNGKYPGGQYGYNKKGSSERIGYDEDDKEKYEKKVTIIKKSYSGEKTDYPEDDGKYPGGQYGYNKKGSSERIGYDEDDKEKYEKKVTIIKKSYSGEKTDYPEDDGKYPGGQYGYNKKGSSERIGYDEDDKEKYEKKVTIIKKSYSGEKTDYPEDDGKYPGGQYGYNKKGSSERIGYDEDDKEKYEKKGTIIKKSYSGEKTDYPEDDGKYPVRHYGYQNKGSSERISYDQDDQDKYEKKVSVVKKSYSGEVKGSYGSDGYADGNPSGYKKGSGESYQFGGYGETEGEKDKYEEKITVTKKTYKENDGYTSGYDGHDYDNYPKTTHSYKKGSAESNRGDGFGGGGIYEKKVTVKKTTYEGETKSYGTDGYNPAYVSDKESAGTYQREGYDEKETKEYQKHAKTYTSENRDRGGGEDSYFSSALYHQRGENKKNTHGGDYEGQTSDYDSYSDSGKSYDGYQKESYAYSVPQKGYRAASVKKNAFAEEQASSGGFYSAAGEKYTNKGEYYGAVKDEDGQKYAGVGVDYGTGYSAGNKVRKVSQGYEDGVVYSAGGSSYGMSHRRANAKAKASAVYVDYAKGSDVDAYGQSEAQGMGKVHAYQATGYSEGTGGEFSYGYRTHAKNGGKVYRKTFSEY